MSIFLVYGRVMDAASQLNNPAYQRTTDRLKNYWEAACDGADIPNESAINPDDLDEIWDHCFLIDLQDKRFRYDYLGSALIEAYGDDISGQEICETLVYPDSPTLFNAMQEAHNTRKPVYDDGEFANKKGVRICYRCIVLPLKKSSEPSARYVLGCMRWRGYAKP